MLDLHARQTQRRMDKAAKERAERQKKREEVLDERERAAAVETTAKKRAPKPKQEAPVKEPAPTYKPQTHFTAIIGHAEECDLLEDCEYRNPIDPPLNSRGVAQARQAGKSLKKYFDDNGLEFDEMYIETSPFLSSMMTAS